jgi:hypothetical protein
MKFKELLFEGRSEPITIEDFEKIKDNYSEAIDAYLNDYKIYRGIDRAKGKILTVKPSNFTRTSANTYNHVTILVDGMKEWKKYPDRAKSIICSSSDSNAESYGDLYIVLPKNGANIGICSSTDWWGSFGDITIDSVNNVIENMIGATGERVSYKNYNSLIDIIKYFDSHEEECLKKMQSYRIYVYNKIKGDYNTFEEAITDYLNPNNYNFKHVNISKYKTVGSHEVWTDSDSIIIQESEFVHFLSKEGII